MAVVLVVVASGPARAGEAGLVTFRVTSLELRDPHVFTLLFGSICQDSTATLNNSIAGDLTSDGDGDGFADMNILLALRPLDPLAGCGAVAAGEGLCTMPLSSTTCERDPAQAVDLLAHENLAVGTCLAPLPGTTRDTYAPPITVSGAPCFVAGPFELDWAVFPVPVVLEHAEVAATYSGDPPSGLVDGLLRGFLSETQADTVLFPASFPLVGGQPVSSALPGGAGNCAAHDDRDVGPDGVTSGWWLYWNFTAEVVPFTCTGAADVDTSCGVDLVDFQTWQACVSGEIGAKGDCLCHLADINDDLRRDLRDYAGFQGCFSGTGGTADPGCPGP